MDRVYINMKPEIHNRIESMAALHGMSFNDFVVSRAVLEIPNSITLAAIEELSVGGGSKYASFNDFLNESEDE